MDALSKKSVALREAVLRLIDAVGYDRVICDDTDTADDPESVAVVSRSDPLRAVVVSVTSMPADRYSISYDKLKTKFGGDASITRATASNVMLQGMAWVTRKVIENGVVTGEFETIPKKPHRLRA